MICYTFGMMQDIRLRSLLAVIRTASFSAAADLVHVTQPAVSQHIRSLEIEFGTVLLNRSGRHTTPTRTGELLFSYAERIEAAYRSMSRDLENATGATRTYDIGATLTIAEYLLPPLLGAYRKASPQVRVRMSVQNTEETIGRLLANHVVLALVEGPFEPGRLSTVRFSSDELVVACAPGHQICRQTETGGVPAEELLKADLILREPGSGTRTVFERYLLQQGIDPRELKPYMEIGSINAIKSLVMSELGVTVIASSAIARELAEGTLVTVPLADGPITRDLTFAWHESADLDFVVQFIGFCTRQTWNPAT